MSANVIVRHGSCPSYDDEGLADYRSMASMRADAVRGSKKLRTAILRLEQKAKRRRADFRPRTWNCRLKAMERTRRILIFAASHFKIAVEDLTSPTRGPEWLARKRQIVMFVARNSTTASYPDIGKCFGRDHSTVIHACRLVEADTDALNEAIKLRERLCA